MLLTFYSYTKQEFTILQKNDMSRRELTFTAPNSVFYQLLCSRNCVGRWTTLDRRRQVLNFNTNGRKVLLAHMGRVFMVLFNLAV